MDAIPPEAFLEAYPEPMRAIAERLRRIVRRAEPTAIERVRLGWHLIGYDIPAGAKSAYFAYVAPEREHVHLGFEHGYAMRDPRGVLQGRGITRQVRWLTFVPGDRLDEPLLQELLHEAALVARMSRGERALAVEDRSSSS